MNAPTLSGTQWAERYEALRQYVLEGHRHLAAEPLGFGLVCRSGLSGWMETWQRASAAAPVSPVSPTVRCPATPGWQHELTVLLAEMTVQHLRPAFP